MIKLELEPRSSYSPNRTLPIGFKEWHKAVLPFPLTYPWCQSEQPLESSFGITAELQIRNHKRAH